MSNDGEYMLAEDAKEVVDVGEEKPRQFVMVGDPYVPFEGNDDSSPSESSKVSDSKILSSEKKGLANIFKIRHNLFRFLEVK